MVFLLQISNAKFTLGSLLRKQVSNYASLSFMAGSVEHLGQ